MACEEKGKRIKIKITQILKQRLAAAEKALEILEPLVFEGLNCKDFKECSKFKKGG